MTVAHITGAARGIGNAIDVRLALHAGAHGQASSLPADVGSERQVVRDVDGALVPRAGARWRRPRPLLDPDSRCGGRSPTPPTWVTTT